MPELPEVETILHGLKPCLEGKTIQDIVIRQPQLRWPIPAHLKNKLIHQTIGIVSRRAKYLIIPVTTGTLLVHLGMSGSLRIVNRNIAPGKHDHVDLIFSDNELLRYNDPRRFGALLWTEDPVSNHPLIKPLGPEPFEPHFTTAYLQSATKNRRVPIKSLIMNQRVVVGVGNIYAAEALFLAKIHPSTPAGNLTTNDCARLVASIQQVLLAAIQQGGTTIKDFRNSQGKPGYFTQQLQVYGRAGLACSVCNNQLETIRLGQRSTVFCAHCQH
jgi:formamidopyrimidine-DNA glycosylase